MRSVRSARGLAVLLAVTAVVAATACGKDGGPGNPQDVTADPGPDDVVVPEELAPADVAPSDEGVQPPDPGTDPGYDPGTSPFDGWFTDKGGEDGGTLDPGGAEVCVKDCTNRVCGSDGCGGTCGACTGTKVCDEASGQCGGCHPPSTWGPAAALLTLETPEDPEVIDHQCQDFAGDGSGDNGLKGFAPAVNAALKAGLESGWFHLLFEFQDVKDLVNYSPFLLNALAAWPEGDGVGYRLDPETYDPDTCRPRSYFAAKGVLKEGALSIGPNNFISVLPIQGLLAKIRVEKIRIKGQVTGTGDGADVASGLLTAALKQGELTAALNGLKASCNTAHPKPLCAQVPLLETLAASFAADVDLDGDGAVDAMSMCFQFTAKAARIDGFGCVPVCAGLECGPDGCGGTCGACAGDLVCDAGGRCAPPCEPPQAWGPTGAVSAISIVEDPAVIEAVCPDRDYDGKADNGLKGFAAALNPKLADALAEGTWAPLLEFAGVEDLQDTASFVLNGLKGLPAGTEAQWLLDPESYDPASCDPRILSMAGSVLAAGALSAGPQDVVARIPWQGVTLEVPLRQVVIRGPMTGGPGGVVTTAGTVAAVLAKTDLQAMVAGFQGLCNGTNPPGICANLGLLKDLVDNAPYDLDLDQDGTPETLSACARFLLSPALIVGM